MQDKLNINCKLYIAVSMFCQAPAEMLIDLIYVVVYLFEVITRYVNNKYAYANIVNETKSRDVRKYCVYRDRICQMPAINRHS